MIQNKTVRFENLALIDYKQAWDYQESLLAEVIGLKIANKQTGESKPTPNHLLFCQHPHVYTLGKSGQQSNLLVNAQELQHIGAQYYRINRGGDITYHGPGQLVVYPIFDLDNFFTDIHRYMRTLEEAVILTCADYGIAAGRIAGLTGVWIDYQEGQGNPRKICAMGVKASRWVTMHGLALNVNTNLSYFSHMIPCGITDKSVTSLQQEIGYVIDFEEVEQKLLKHLVEGFGLELL